MIENLSNIWRGFRFGIQALLLIGHLCACHTPPAPLETPAKQIVQL